MASPKTPASPKTLVLLAAASALLGAPRPAGGSLPARAGDALVDSVGVNTHITYTNTIYAMNFSQLQATLRDIGVRHIRDGCYAGWHRANELDMVDVQCIPEVSAANRLDFTQLEPQLRIAQQNISRLVSLEGPNEYDLSGDQCESIHAQFARFRAPFP